MQVPLCEVVGCRRAASWVRVTNISARFEDFLCCCCWQSLRGRKPVEAACYVHSNIEDDTESEHFEESVFDFSDEAVIVIN